MNASMTMKLSKRLSFGEEVANSVTHAVGAVAMLVLLPITAIYSYQHYGIEAAVGMSIFDISLFLMFLSSTIYHSMQYDSPQKFIADYRPQYDLHCYCRVLHSCRSLFSRWLARIRYYYLTMGRNYFWYFI